MRTAVVGAVAGALALACGQAWACDSFAAVPPAKASELMDALSKGGPNAMTRVAAFRELACADDPELRREALVLAFKSDERMLRSAALAEALMRRDGVRIDLTDDPKLDAAAKTFVKGVGGSLEYQFKAKDRAKNCINFSNGQPACYADSVFIIDGPAVRLTDRTRSPSITAELVLQPDNTLKGKLRRERTQPIDATIALMQ